MRTEESWDGEEPAEEPWPVRLPEGERERIREAAEFVGMEPGEFVRDSIMVAVTETLADKARVERKSGGAV